MNKDASDKEILDYAVDSSGNTIRDIGSISFLNYVAKKINGLPAYSAAMQELVLAISTPPMGVMPEEEKIRIFRKLLTLDIEL